MAVRGGRELRAELCFGCDHLRVDDGETLDIQFGGSAEPLETWARQTFDDPTIGERF